MGVCPESMATGSLKLDRLSLWLNDCHFFRPIVIFFFLLMITFVTLSVPLNKKNNESIMACMNQRYRAAVSNNAKGLLDFYSIFIAIIMQPTQE